MTRYAARTDSTQAPIVAAMRAAGAGVELIGKPLDLLVSAGGRWGVLEVKASEYESRRPSKTRKGQLKFADRHPNGGPIGTVWDIEGALRFVEMLRSYAKSHTTPD
jgi:hypothetical protein